MRIFPTVIKKVTSGGGDPWTESVSLGVGVAETTAFQAITDDASANDLDLTLNGSLTTVSSSQAKYGDGVGGFSASNYLSSTNASLRIVGDLSIFIAFKRNAIGTAHTLMTIGGDEDLDDEANNRLLRLLLNSDNTVQLVHESGAGTDNVLSSTLTVSADSHTMTLTRNTSTKTYVVNVDGVEFINATYTSNPTGGSANFQMTIGRSNAATSSSLALDGEVHECRIWNTLVAQATLDEIADPNNANYTNTPEGTETACYFLQGPETLRFDIAVAAADTNAEPTEAVQLDISGPNFEESNATPTEARSALLRVWLANSAGTGVSNPGNANGSNDATNAVVSTSVGGSNPETMTSDIGVNIPAGITFSSAIYRGWFRARTPLGTSTASVIAHSSSALFSDIVMFTLSSTSGDTNHLSGTFTFDLVAAGIDTLAKLQSLQIFHRCQDAAAGVTPAILDVDAGAADIVATSI